MSMRPVFSRISGIIAAQLSEFSKSVTCAMALPPHFLVRVASAFALRSTITTVAPARIIVSEDARPIPDAAPVTTAILPANTFVIFYLHEFSL